MCVSEMEAKMFKILRAYRANEDPVLGKLRGKVISTLSKEEIVTEMTTLGIDVVGLCKIWGLQEETIMDKNNCIHSLNSCFIGDETSDFGKMILTSRKEVSITVFFFCACH